MLTPKNSFHEGDVRHYGENKQQLAMDKLLLSWAQTTWNLPSNLGKDFHMRVAENLQAVEETRVKDLHPQADWKYTKGRVKRGLAP